MTSESTPSGITLGCYHLGPCVGEGGAGKVFRGEGPGGREVAVKLLGRRVGDDDRLLRRFEREVEALARLRHPGLVELVDHGVDPDLGPFLVTAFVSGETLGRFLARAGPLGPEGALVLALPVIEALSAMHRAGLVHRDVKPDNVMVTPLGRVVLVDLGLALHEDHARLTSSGAVSGTLPYMSPEQVEGRRPLTAASDVWQVGVLLHELVTGAHPFAAFGQAEQVRAILESRPSPLAELDPRCSPALTELVRSCLVREPSHRHPDASVLLGRARDCVDWAGAEDLSGEAARVVADPQAFLAGVAVRQAELLREDAEELLEDGESFAALRRLSRALAYLPESPETLALVERAASPEVGPRPAEPRKRTGRAVGLTAVALVLAALVATVVVRVAACG